MKTATPDTLHAALATIAGVNHHPGSVRWAVCTDTVNGAHCGRTAVAHDPANLLWLCAGHLKLAAAGALELEAWDVDGVR